MRGTSAGLIRPPSSLRVASFSLVIARRLLSVVIASRLLSVVIASRQRRRSNLLHSPYVIASRQRRRSNLLHSPLSLRAANGGEAISPHVRRGTIGVGPRNSQEGNLPPCAQRHSFRLSRRLLRGGGTPRCGAPTPLAMTRGRAPPPLRCHCGPPLAAKPSPSPCVIASRLRRRSHLLLPCHCEPPPAAKQSPTSAECIP